jgi:hypothetical protein
MDMELQEVSRLTAAGRCTGEGAPARVSRASRRTRSTARSHAAKRRRIRSYCPAAARLSYGLVKELLLLRCCAYLLQRGVDRSAAGRNERRQGRGVRNSGGRERSCGGIARRDLPCARRSSAAVRFAGKNSPRAAIAWVVGWPAAGNQGTDFRSQLPTDGPAAVQIRAGQAGSRRGLRGPWTQRLCIALRWRRHAERLWSRVPRRIERPGARRHDRSHPRGGHRRHDVRHPRGARGGGRRNGLVLLCGHGPV